MFIIIKNINKKDIIIKNIKSYNYFNKSYFN